MRTAVLITVLAAALACSLATAPAHARARTFVASYGNDANPCTFGSPCKTFQQAVNVVDPGGEVTAIDSAGFGPININKTVTITSPAGIEAGIVPADPTANAIDVISATATDTIVLRGLTLQSAGGGAIGVHALTGAAIEIVDCTVRGFSTGIDIASENALSVVISNTLVADNGYGVYLQTALGTIHAALDGIRSNNNTVGIAVQNGSGGYVLQTTITNSHLDNSATTGLLAVGTGGNNFTLLKNVSISQTPTGISMNGGSAVYLSQVVLDSYNGEFTAISFNGNTSTNVAYRDGTNHIGVGMGGGATLTAWNSNLH